MRTFRLLTMLWIALSAMQTVPAPAGAESIARACARANGGVTSANGAVHVQSRFLMQSFMDCAGRGGPSGGNTSPRASAHAQAGPHSGNCGPGLVSKHGTKWAKDTRNCRPAGGTVGSGI